METYNLEEMNKLYKETNKRNEIFESKYLFKKTDKIANEIRQSSNEIFSNTLLLKQFHEQIISNVQMLKDVVTYEFLFYNPETKIDNPNDLIEQTKNELSKYQGIVGGFKIEDNIWLDCKSNTNRFKLKPNQFAIYNSINRNNIYDTNESYFLKLFCQHMTRFIDESNFDLSFYYKVYDDEDSDIGWILFICEDKSQNEYNDYEEFEDTNIDEIMECNDVNMLENTIEN